MILVSLVGVPVPRITLLVFVKTFRVDFPIFLYGLSFISSIRAISSGLIFSCTGMHGKFQKVVIELLFSLIINNSHSTIE